MKCLIDSKYPGMEQKFGIWKVHHHFDLAADEILHETSDPITKESTLRIIKRDALPQGAFASSWSLGSNGPEVHTWCCDWQPRPV